MDLGTILAQLRKQNGQNQREFANTLGISNGAVAMWETNKRQPDLEMIKRISDYYNVSIDYLLGKSSHPSNNDIFDKLTEQENELICYYRKFQRKSSMTKSEKESLANFFPDLRILSDEEEELIKYYEELSLKDKRWIMGQMIDLIKKSEEQKMEISKVQ